MVPRLSDSLFACQRIEMTAYRASVTLQTSQLYLRQIRVRPGAAWLPDNSEPYRIHASGATRRSPRGRRTKRRCAHCGTHRFVHVVCKLKLTRHAFRGRRVLFWSRVTMAAHPRTPCSPRASVLCFQLQLAEATAARPTPSTRQVHQRQDVFIRPHARVLAHGRAVLYGQETSSDAAWHARNKRRSCVW